MVFKKRVIYFNFIDYFICYFLNYPLLMGSMINKKQTNKGVNYEIIKKNVGYSQQLQNN